MKDKTFLAMACAAAVLAWAELATAQSGGTFRGVADRALGKLLGQDVSRRMDVRRFDVAGVRLGMISEEALRVLRSKGFTPRATQAKQDSWTRRLSQSVADRRGTKVEGDTVPMHTIAEGMQGERIEVWYVAAPIGAEVISVRYTMPIDRMERATFVQGLQSRYGEPSTEQRSRTYYCTNGDARCPTLVGPGELPMVRTETSAFDGKHMVELTEGTRARERRKAEFAAAVEAAAPRNARASF